MTRFRLRPLDPEEARLRGTALSDWMRTLRITNPAVPYGTCLCCAHEPHERGCVGRDYWGNVCGCTTKEIRGRLNTCATDEEAVGDFAKSDMPKRRRRS